MDRRKGGLGTSLLSTTAAGRIIARGCAESLLVIDGDVTNLDVARRFRSTGASIAQAEFRLPDEWIPALNIIEQVKADRVVISLPEMSGKGERAQSLQLVVSKLALAIERNLVRC
jgi:hypothetical protein